MSIKAGQILHDAHGYVLDRIQSAGVTSLNIPEEKIYELGNFRTVATVRDIPDLSFDCEQFDMTCEMEAIITGQDPTTIIAGQEFDFNNYMPIDVISPFKSGTNAYDIVKGVAIPYLTLEKATYRFGVKQNATQTFTFRGDTINYIPGTPYYQEFTNTGAATYSFTNTAIEYVEAGISHYALCVVAINRSTHTWKRLFQGTDYTNTSSGFTTTGANAGYTKFAVTYGSATAGTYLQTVHQNVSIKPAAIRGKDIDIYVGNTSATPVFTRWTSVQSFEVNRTVNLDKNEEFGNAHYTSQDYDTADVSGTIGVRAQDPAELWTKLAQVANIATNKIIGPYTSVFLPVEIRITDPDTGTLLKTLYIPDCRFTVPAIQGKVQSKLETSFAFSSDGGTLKVYSGAR